jgi:hypothetical protein
MADFYMWDAMHRFLVNLSKNEKNMIYEWSERVFSPSESLSGRLDRLFERLPPLPYDLVVYRALNEVDWSQVTYDIDRFTATTVNPAAAKHFGGSDCCYMKIIVPAGCQVLPVSFAHGLTRYPKDMEILLPRRGIFKVIGAERIDIEQYEMSMYPPEIAAMIAAFTGNMQKTYRNEKLFVVVRYKPDGRMTRLQAAENIGELRKIYGIDNSNYR